MAGNREEVRLDQMVAGPSARNHLVCGLCVFRSSRAASSGQSAVQRIIRTPLGQGTVAEGERLFHDRCEGRHQAGGTKPPGPGLDVLVGGKGTVGTAKPLRTIGSYWPILLKKSLAGHGRRSY